MMAGTGLPQALRICAFPEGLRASIMAPATPFCFWTTQMHLTVKRTMGSMI